MRTQVSTHNYAGSPNKFLFCISFLCTLKELPPERNATVTENKKAADIASFITSGVQLRKRTSAAEFRSPCSSQRSKKRKVERNMRTKSTALASSVRAVTLHRWLCSRTYTMHYAFTAPLGKAHYRAARKHFVAWIKRCSGSSNYHAGIGSV